MDKFYQGMVASVGMLGGVCAFIYCMFYLLGKMIETKISALETKIEWVALYVHKIAEELREERRSKDYLYRFVIQNVRKD